MATCPPGSRPGSPLSSNPTRKRRPNDAGIRPRRVLPLQVHLGDRGHARPSSSEAAPVIDDPTTTLRRLIDRLKNGDDTVRWELLERAFGRLQSLASQILGDFPRVKDDGLWQTTEVAAEARVRLARALKEVRLTDKQHFFRLAALKIRQLLLDLVRRLPRSKRGGQADRPPGPPARPAHDYQDVLTRLLELLPGIPEEQYAVLDLQFSFGLNDREIAAALEVDESTVRRRRRRAREAIARALRDAFPGLDEGLAPGQ